MLTSSRLALAAFSFVAIAAVGCSGGSSSTGSSSDTEDTTLSTHLEGLYEATTAGDVAWISFFGDNGYSLAHGDDACSGDDVPASCVSVGTYTIDTTSKTIALTDASTNATTTFPIAAVASTTNAPVSLTTKDERLDDGLVSGSGGSIVNNSSAPLVTPAGLSLVTSSGTQSLVSSPSDAASCGSSDSSGSSSSSSSSSSSGGSCMAGGSGSQARVHQPSVQGLLNTIGTACSNAALICSVCANLLGGAQTPTATDIMQTTFMQCTISKKPKN